MIVRNVELCEGVEAAERGGELGEHVVAQPEVLQREQLAQGRGEHTQAIVRSL